MIRLLIVCFMIAGALANYHSSSPWTSHQTRNQHSSGQYSYSFKVHAPSFVQHQWEKANAYNEREGAYSFQDAYGRQRIVRYVADKYGFRPIIQSNEPGLALKPSAHVLFSPLHISHSPQHAPITYSPSTPYSPRPVYRVKPAEALYVKPTPTSAPIAIYKSRSVASRSLPSKKPIETLNSQYSAPISSSAVLPSLQTFTWPHSYQVISGKSVSPPVVYTSTSSLVGPSPYFSRAHYPTIYPTTVPVVSIKSKAKIVPQITPLYTTTTVVSKHPKSYSTYATANQPISPSSHANSIELAKDQSDSEHIPISLLKSPIESTPSYFFAVAPKPVRTVRPVRIHSLLAPTHLRYFK